MNYADRIAEVWLQGALQPNGAYSIEVEHGVGCKHHQDRARPCTCTPDITITDLRSDCVVVVGAEGDILERKRRS